jgi:hypothetical protein
MKNYKEPIVASMSPAVWELSVADKYMKRLMGKQQAFEYPQVVCYF